MDKILGALCPFQITDADGNFTGPHLGVRVACTEFQNNVIRYGGFDGCHFLLGRGTRSDEEIAQYITSHGWDSSRIRIYDGALPLDRIAGNKYHVLHKPDLGLDDILQLRHTLGKPLAPATAMNHTLSYGFLMAQWMELLLGHVLSCDALVCTSRASREVVEKTFELLSERLSTQVGAHVPPFRGRLEIIPLGVDVDYWRPDTDKAKAKKLLELPEHSCLILCPARFSTSDKMDLRPLLLVIRRLVAMLAPDCFRVVLVGDEKPEHESILIQEFVDKLQLTAAVRIDTQGDPSRIRQYYGAADVFVSIPDNIQETFGLTVVQAMACGLPAVVSDWNGYKDTVVHQETGLRVHTHWAECDSRISDLSHLRAWTVDHLLLAQSVSVDMDELVTVLHRLIIDPRLRHRWGEAGRKRAEQVYAWPVVIRQYRELWDQCQERFGHTDLQEWIRTDHASILSPQYFRQFRHYPSEIVSAETNLALTTAGAEELSGANPPGRMSLPPVMRQVFPPAVFQALISRLSQWPVTFGSLVAGATDETGHPPDLVARQIMWMMKYGIVRAAKTVKEYRAEAAAKSAGAREAGAVAIKT